METKLALYFLDYEIQKIYNYFSLGEKEKLKEINQSIIIIDVPIPKIIYEEHFIIDFKLYKNNKEANDNEKSFNLDIFINRLNQYFCFINCINNYSIDIIIFRNDYENIPKAINIKANKNYSLDKSNTFGLKKCKKLGVINCDKSYISEFDFNFPTNCIQGSYYLYVFYSPNNKPPKFSLRKIKQKKKKNFDFSTIPVEKKNFLLQMKYNFINLYNQFDKSDKNDKNEKQTKINFYSQLIKIFEENNISFNELEDLPYLLRKNISLNLSNEEFDIYLGYVIYILAKEIAFWYDAIIFAGLIIDLLNELQSNLGEYNLNILKILLWFNKSYLNEREFINSIHFIKELKVPTSILDFKLCLPKKCEENTPYHNAYIFINNFIDKLSEDSFILESIYRHFKFSLLSLEQIKSCLRNQIPEVFIRFQKPIKPWFNCSYIIKHGLIGIFENEIINSEIDLDKYLINEKDVDCKYSIPIIMVIINDYFCSGKMRLIQEDNENSNYFNNAHIKDKDVIKFLKYSLQPLSELLDVDLWVGKDLDKLMQIVYKKMENFDMSVIAKKIDFFSTVEIDYLKFGGKQSNSNSDSDSEIFDDLDEDDKKILKLKKKMKKRNEIFC